MVTSVISVVQKQNVTGEQYKVKVSSEQHKMKSSSGQQS